MGVFDSETNLNTLVDFRMIDNHHDYFSLSHIIQGDVEIQQGHLFQQNEPERVAKPFAKYVFETINLLLFFRSIAVNS